jgi:folylpolyglutamate synthase
MFLPLSIVFQTNVFRWDCISINGKTIGEHKFRTVEKHFLEINAKHQIGASPFEILTATAFTIFNDARVEVGVVEVGMGGKLDTTNILNNQAVSVISKIARDHEGFLGNSLAEIAGHKAGILRPNVPYIVNAENEANVQMVIQDYAREIGAGPRLSTSDFQLTERLYDTTKWQRVTATMAPFQSENLKLAVVAVMQTLHSIDQNPKHGLRDIAKTLLANLKNRHHGRQEFVHVTPVFKNATERRNHVLVDGAHNPDAAVALDGFVRDTLRYGQSPARERPASGWPVTWVLAMTEGKDAHRYLATLLKPGDKVVTTTFGPVDGMPWVKPMDPKKLLEICKSVEPRITGVHVPVIGALRAICTAKYISDQGAAWSPIVLTGSLYLVGDLHRELRPRSAKTWWTDTDEATTADRESFLKIQAEERERVGAILGSESGSGEGAVGEHEEPEIKEQRKLQEELDALNREVQGLEIEEKRLAQAHSATLDTSGDVASLSAAERLERDERRFAKLHLTPEQLTAQITRAEKAEAALARHAEMVEAAKQERQARLEKRAKQKERLEARRERRAERKAQLKQVQAPRKGLALQDELPKATLSSGKPKAAVREVPQDIPTNVYHLGHQGGPPVLSKPEPKNTFFGKPASSATSQTPKTSPTGAEPQDAPRETAASRDPRGRRKTPAQRKSHERRTRPKHEYGNGPSQPI